MSLHHQIFLDSPAGYWPLDELSGTIPYDRSGNARDAFLVGSPTPNAVGPAGLRAWAMSGAGSTYIQVPSNAAWASHAGASGVWTYEGWLYKTATGRSQTFFSRGTTASTYEGLFRVKSDETFEINMLTSAGAEVMLVNAGSCPLNEWCHVAVTYDRAAQLLIFYYNGVEVARDTTASGTSSDTGGPVFLGNRQDGPLTASTHAWNGRMAQVALFPTALSAARIKAHYEAGIRSGVVGGPGTYGGSAYGTAPYGGGTGAVSTAIYVELAGTALVTLSGSGNLTLITLISGTAVVVLSGTAALRALLPLTTTHTDPSQMAKVNFTAYGMLDVDVPVTPPPSTVSVSKFKRNSITMPAPVLNSKGLPT